MSYERLRPVHYDAQGPKNAYRPKFPWKKWLALAAVVSLILGGYFWRQKVRADAARADLRALHTEQVRPILTALRAIVADLEEKTLQAGQGAANREVDTALRFSELHDKSVVYARVRAVDLRTAEEAHKTLQVPPRDAIDACLGLQITPASALYEVPEVLEAKWLSEADDTNDMLRLNMRREQLRLAIQNELPPLRAHLGPDYFLLAVVQGHDRLKDPVDVFLWDLRADRLVLRSRTEATGRLITARSQFGDATAPGAPQDRPELAADCSIAAHLKAVTGEPVQ